MTARVVLLDTGIGNIQSVANILEHIGANFEVSDRVESLVQADKVIFPGVGTYGNAMESIRKKGLDAALTEALLKQRKPGMGICVGMQVLSSIGREFGEFQGLGLVPGAVERISVEGKGLRLPHVGWNEVSYRAGNPLFAGIPENASFYFLHSYHLVAEDRSHVVATVDYGSGITAAVQNGNIFGVQFHPEKSQEFGIQLMKNFVSL